MAEERYNQGHHAGSGAAERIRNRLKPSAEPQRGSGDQVKLGDGPTRVVTTVHPSGNTRQHGDVRRGEAGRGPQAGDKR